MGNSGETTKQLKIIAASAVRTLSKIAEAADSRLKQPTSVTSPELFTNPNTYTFPEAPRNLDHIKQDNTEGLRLLTREPAIARIVTVDEKGRRRVYYICRSTSVSIADEDVTIASYRAPMGRLASLSIGEDIIFNNETFEVVEKARLYPQFRDQKWDSLNSILEGKDQIVTVESFQALLGATSSDEYPDLLDRLLEEEIVYTNIQEGLRRSIIMKTELRDQPILDRYQDEIFRLPINSQLLLLGAPGTGKTTTLIRRLGQKLDLEALKESEREVLKNLQDLDYASSWIMFTPTELLKQYVKEAFSRESIPAPDERIKTWSNYRRELARETFGILSSESSRGSYIMKEKARTIAPETLSDQCTWFVDFDQWQKASFWDEMRVAANSLSDNEMREVSKLGRRALTIIDVEGAEPSSGNVIRLTDTVVEVRSRIKSMRTETDGKIRGALNLQVNRDPQFLDHMAAYIDSLGDAGDEIDDQDLDDDEEIERPKTRRAAAVAAYGRALRTQARVEARKRTINKSSRTGRLLEWIDERGLEEKERLDIGESLLIQSTLRQLANPVRRYVDRIPVRYRRFRRLRQNENLWYRKEKFATTDIHPLEIDLLLLAALRSGNELIGVTERLRGFENVDQSTLLRQKEILRIQVLVDEAMDFSPIQLGCMVEMALPEVRSFFACGDFNQRVTSWGVRSIEELKWALPDIDTRPISMAYRQSKQLHDVAKRIVMASGGETVDIVLPDYVDNEGVSPVLAKNLSEQTEIVKWLSERIREIERLMKQLPSIAVLVNREEEVNPIATGLSSALLDQNIRVVACPNGQVIGLESDVRVFDVQYIKGLEFEAVFFIGVDYLARNHPDVFEKYLYVGATRAATYLGLTCEQDLPENVADLEDLFQQDWR